MLYVVNNDFGFSILKNLRKYYDNLDLEGKQQFIGLIFPEKFVFENNQFRTKHLRPAVLLICLKIKGIGGYKKELAIKFDDQSTNVTPIGFEPMAHSLEGCCSIQLSYGANHNLFPDLLLYPPDSYRESYGANHNLFPDLLLYPPDSYRESYRASL